MTFALVPRVRSGRLYSRIRTGGWDVERAITTPLAPRNPPSRWPRRCGLYSVGSAGHPAVPDMRLPLLPRNEESA